MQRVLIIGSGGAGKSVLARRLGAITGLPVIHLDAHHWKPGWVASPRPEWDARVKELTAGERWILDGNYGSTLDIRIDAADTVIFLDFFRLRCLLRVIVRRLRSGRGRTRPDMAPGCPERLDLEFLHWIWTFPERRARYLKKLGAHADEKRVHVLRTPRAVSRFVHAVADERRGPGSPR